MQDIDLLCPTCSEFAKVDKCNRGYCIERYGHKGYLCCCTSWKETEQAAKLAWKQLHDREDK